jgi:hypothetical protein
MKIDYENAPEVAEISPESSIRREQEIADVNSNLKLTKQEKDNLIMAIYSKYHNGCFVNIVEEPEQNLFPSSQKAILFSLLKFNNLIQGNKLIITTHSPYLINYLTLSVKAYKVREYLRALQKNEDDKIKTIVPIESAIDPDDLVIYELNENNGTIIRLKDYKGLPSDDNYLNDSLGDSNEQFAQLQEIEKGWL